MANTEGVNLKIQSYKNKDSHMRHMRPRATLEDSGQLFGTLDLYSLSNPTTSVTLESFDFIASYNWSNSDEPVIFVPGNLSFILKHDDV